MLIGNVLPTQGMLRVLAENTNNDVFHLHQRPFDWPTQIEGLLNDAGYKWAEDCPATTIGGKMNIYVIQHDDPLWNDKINMSLVWFPKVSKNGLNFVASYGGEMKNQYVRSGNIYIFDHTQPHFVGNEWGGNTGVWYFMTECIEEKCDE
jgi:hypothetical protein